MGSSAIIQAFTLGAQCRSMLTKARYRYQYPMMACMLRPRLVLLDWVEQVCDAKAIVVVIIENASTNMRRSMRPILASRQEAADQVRVANWLASRRVTASAAPATSAQQRLTALRERVRAKQELATQT